MQIILAMIEAEQIDPRLLPEDPVGAVQQWSHDPALRARASMVSRSAVQWQSWAPEEEPFTLGNIRLRGADLPF
jgi:hypothetical protein